MSDIDQVIRAAISQGWSHDRTTRGHHQFFSPDGSTIVTTSGTPSDRRSFNNFIADMKRGGFVMNTPPKKRAERGSAFREMYQYLQRHEGIEVPKSELRAFVRSVIPGLSEAAIGYNFQRLSVTPTITNTMIGMVYRAEAKAEAPVAAPAPTPTISSDSDERDLDEALEALAKIEQVIRRHREVAKFLAAAWAGNK